MNEKRVAELEREIRRHNRKYYDEDTPEISDVEYDKLVGELKKLCPDSPVFEDVGHATFGKKVKHSSIVGSMSKCHSAQEVVDKFSGKRIIAMPKIDGCSLTLRYKNGAFAEAITRGDGAVGEDVAANACFVQGIPMRVSRSGDVEIRGEAYIAKTDFYGAMDVPGFDGFADGLANPRNAASGGLRQKDPKKTQDRKIRFVAYRCFDGASPSFGRLSDCLDALKKERFETPSFWTKDIGSESDVSDLIAMFESWNAELPYETDGIVFRIDDEQEFEAEGYSSKRPKAALAYKFETEKVRSVITDVEWTMTRMGRAAPVAIIEPKEICGSVVGRITLNNLDWIKNADVAIGDTIVFEKANEIIPKLTSVVKRASKRNINRPSKCPSCGESLSEDENGVHLICTNLQCPAQYKEMLLNMLVKLGILGVAAATIDKIVDAGKVKNPWEIFDLSEKDLVGLGFGSRQAEIVISSLHAITPSPFEVLASIGIPMWGRRMFEILSKNNPAIGKAILAGKFDEAELATTKMVGPQKAKVLANAFKNEKTFASRCLKELLIRFQTKVEKKAPSTGSLAGKSFCLTGVLSRGRKEVEKDIEGAGGEIHSVSANLDYLVVGSDAGSKLAKARKLGIKIIDEQTLMSMIA